MNIKSILLMLLCISEVKCFDHDVVPACGPDAKTCEFNWTVDYLETMVVFEDGGRGYPVVLRNGTLMKRTSCDTFEPLNEIDIENIITGDGSHKLVYAINGQVPNPSLVVYEDQEIVVNLKNNLMEEGLTIHWHGMIQRGTPWMDGVGGISQCPINPGETFTYRFKAYPTGTHWYHSHLGTERTDGLAGALVVLKKPTPKNEKDRLPTFDKEFVLVLQDWKRAPSTEIKKVQDWGMNSYSYGFNDSRCFAFTTGSDGGIVGLSQYESGIINGKGTPNTIDTEVINLPLETFVIKRNNFYRFRIINVGMLFGFRVSVDKHTIQIISVDGNDVDMTDSESIVIHGAERVDFVINAEAHIGNYWIRAETLEELSADGPVEPGRALAILRYEGAKAEDPKTTRRPCTKKNPCRVVNCPFGSYPKHRHMDCMPVSDLTSTPEELKRNPVPLFTKKQEFQEIFLNIHFSSGDNLPLSPSVSGHTFILPSSPPQIYPTGSDYLVSCDDKNCTDHCECTHIVKLKKDAVIQIILNNQDDVPFGMAHPIHMHGHHFHVMKIGYPEYNDTTGEIIEPNNDIACNTKSCNLPSWRNESWENGKVPGLNLKNPPMKDTIIVPRYGYIVIRIKADNPGFWFVHCHIEPHQLGGMALILQEGRKVDMEPTPEGFPTCGDFRYTSSIKRKRKTNNQEIYTEEELLIQHVDSSVDTKHGIVNNNQQYKIPVLFTVVLGISIFVNVVMIFSFLYWSCKTRHTVLNTKNWFENNLGNKQPWQLKNYESKEKLVPPP